MLWFTKQRKKKARNTLICLWGENFGFSGQIQGIFRPFPACFGHIGRIGRRSIRPNIADTTRFWPVQCKSKPIWHESSHYSANQAESVRIWGKKKKKNSDVAPTRRQPHQMPHPTWGRVGRKCGTLLAAFVLSRLRLRFLIVVNKSLINLVYNLCNLSKKKKNLVYNLCRTHHTHTTHT